MTLRVAVVEDSEIAASMIAEALREEGDISVVAAVESIGELLEQPIERTADVLVLDLLLPGRAGLSAIREIVPRVPVVAVSDVPADSPLAREALAQGATSFVPKAGLLEREPGARLRTAVRNAAQRREPPAPDFPVLILLGSTGAPRVLRHLMPQLRDLPAATLVLQHLPVDRMATFADWLSSLGFPARLPEQGELLPVGTAIVAPGNAHLLINPTGRLHLRGDEPYEGHIPSGTLLLGSAATLGSRVVAVILSGLGSDGAESVEEILARGGQCLAQAPADCSASSMPRAALARSEHVQEISASRLGETIRRIVRNG